MVCFRNICVNTLYKGHSDDDDDDDDDDEDDDDDDNNNNNTLVMCFMQDIYSYIHETNHISRVYSVAAVLYLQSVLHVMLFRPLIRFVLLY
jgi:hypothetical protein